MTKQITTNFLTRALEKVIRGYAETSTDSKEFDYMKEWIEKEHPHLMKQVLDYHIDPVDVIGDRAVSCPIFNTNIYPYITQLDEMNWGFRGTGAYTLATNILFLYTMGDRVFACKYASDFREDFLVNVPEDENLHIKKEDIYEWINEKVKGELQ